MEQTTFLFIGRSGCGKGTQAKLLMENLKENTGRDPLYFETGSVFRTLKDRNDFTGKRINEMLDAGKFIPYFMPVWLWTTFLTEEVKTGEEILIFDGVARHPDEAHAFESAMGFFARERVIVIVLDVSREWSKARMLSRARHDDTDEKIESRLNYYERDVVPAIGYFETASRYDVMHVNGEQTIEKVHEDIIKALRNA